MLKKIKGLLFQNQSLKQTIFKNTFWLFSGNIISRLLRAALLIYAARVIGAREFGAFNYALSIAAFFTIFADFGINAVITREAASNKEKQEKYFSSALILKIAVSIFLGGVLIIFYPFLISHFTSSQADARLVSTLLPLIILVVLFDTLRDFGASLFRAWEKMEWESFIQIFTNLVIFVAGIMALKNLPSAKSLTLGYVAGTGVGMIISLIPFRHYLKNIKQKFSLSLVKEIYQSSWIFGMIGLTGAIMLNTDSLMIGWLADIEKVGYYGVSQRLAQLIYLLPALIASAFFPTLAKNFQNRERVAFLLKKELHFLILLALPLSTGGVILSQSLILLFFGKEYLPSVIPFVLMALTFLPNFISIALSNLIFVLKKEKILLKYFFLATIGNIFFNFLFIPWLGISGAALSTLINQTIAFLYLRKKIGQEFSFQISPRLEWQKILLSLTAMVLVIFLLKAFDFNALLIVTFGGLAYFVGLFLSRESSINDLRSLFRREKL